MLRRIRDVIRSNLHVAPGILIWTLNPILRGWANYHRHAASKQTFQKIDSAIFQSLWKWCRRRHPHKSRQWIKEKYFHNIGDRHWVFSGEMRVHGETRQIRLYSLAYTPIRRHTKIKGEANPYDPRWETYFEQRLDAKTEGALKGLKMLLFLWREQQGRCPVCQERITKLTGWQTHHLIWKSHGGDDSASNTLKRKLEGKRAYRRSGDHWKTQKVMSREVRAIWRRLNCLNPNLQGWKRHTHRYSV